MTRPCLVIDPLNVAARVRMIGKTRVLTRRDALVLHALRRRVLEGA